MPNFSNNYNKETQKKCIDCGIVYDLAPEYEYSWIVAMESLNLKNISKNIRMKAALIVKR